MFTYVVVGCFILFDILTGFLKALYLKELDSTILRKGLFHKLSEIIAVIGSGLLEYATVYIKLGVDLPLLKVVSVYVCVMELISIIENICIVNPDLTKLFNPYLKKLKGKK